MPHEVEQREVFRTLESLAETADTRHAVTPRKAKKSMGASPVTFNVRKI